MAYACRRAGAHVSHDRPKHPMTETTAAGNSCRVRATTGAAAARYGTSGLSATSLPSSTYLVVAVANVWWCACLKKGVSGQPSRVIRAAATWWVATEAVAMATEKRAEMVGSKQAERGGRVRRHENETLGWRG